MKTPLTKHLETHKTKQINCQIIWQETVRKLIDRLERLGFYVWKVIETLKIKISDFLKSNTCFCSWLYGIWISLLWLLKLYKCYIVRQCSVRQIARWASQVKWKISNMALLLLVARLSFLIWTGDQLWFPKRCQKITRYIHFFAKFGGTCPFLFNFKVVDFNKGVATKGFSIQSN